MNILLKDGSSLAVEAGATALDAAKAISQGLAKAALAAEINGQVKDLLTPLQEGDTLNLLTFADEMGRWTLRHTASHVMAQAVSRLRPGAKFAIGPAIDNGFYYDFDLEEPLSQDDLKAIEKEMDRIVKENLPIKRFELPRQEALAWADDNGQPYKRELIEELPEGEPISFYQQGDFVDLCAGPHLPATGKLRFFKLLSLAGAYWRGSEKNKMLQRVYGTAFDKKDALQAHLTALEEAKKRDHNRLGRELELFTTVDEIGQGLPILLPKGARVVQVLQRFVEDEEQRRGYLLTKTPFMAKRDLYQISGHWDHYRDGMFILGDPDAEGEVFALRPMTCPFQFEAYLNKTRSYRDLPLRYNETSTLFRNESSGEMHGLIRVRQFTISEGHLACTPEQVEAEFRGCLDLANYMLQTLGLAEDVTYRFSKWDPNDKDKYIGSAEQWESTQDFMRRILDHIGIEYTEAEGEAAFYGPKLDIQVKNVHGKEDTLITIQIDFQLAERFGMVYTDRDGQKKHPIVIHRTSIGCYERTLALLIEKYAGAFPTWLAPVQAKIMTITDRADQAALALKQRMEQEGLRPEADLRNEKISFKIREAQMEKVPYMLVLGDKEVEQGQVAVRSRRQGDLGSMSIDDFMALITREVAEKAR
ncbi:MAG: threonine--tRNA ligase [Christensenellales bacterium]